MAEKIAEMSPVAVQGTKINLNYAMKLSSLLSENNRPKKVLLNTITFNKGTFYSERASEM